jgi:hypothetical protein
MGLTCLGKESVPDQSPTLYVSDHDTYVVQGGSSPIRRSSPRST